MATRGGKTRPEAPLKVGVVGVGGMGSGHCQCLQKIAETKLTAVCDIDPDVAAKKGQEFGVPHFSDHRELIASGLCQAITIATPHPPRPPIAVAALAAGLPVLSEKPICDCVSGADAMVAASRKHGVPLAIVYQRRCEPKFRRALELVRAGFLGRLYRATLISPEYRSQAYYNSGGWRATWRGEGGGVMMNQAPHIMDLFVQLAGLPCRVRGHVETRLHQIEVEDHAEAFLTYPDGGTGYFYVSTCEAGAGQMIELFGDRGKLCYRGGDLKLWRYDTPVSEFTKTNTAMWGGPKSLPVRIRGRKCEGGHTGVLRNFARHVLFGDKLHAPGADAVGELELANAIWLSADLGKPVDLPLNRAAYDRFLARKRAEFTGDKQAVKLERTTDARLKL